MLTFKSGNLLEDSDKIEVIFEESFRAIYSEIWVHVADTWNTQGVLTDWVSNAYSECTQNHEEFYGWPQAAKVGPAIPAL